MPQTATPALSNSLSSFKQLSPCIYLYDPSNSTANAPNGLHSNQDQVIFPNGAPTAAAVSTSPPHTSSIPPPKLIILLTWLAAHPAHISKYVLGHQLLFPTSRILLIRSSPADMLYRPVATQRRNLAPAVSTILASCTATSPSGTPTTPDLLLHLFSNGGAHSTCSLLSAFHATTSHALPLHATIFDSCPGRSNFSRTILALSSALLPPSGPSRLPGLVLVYLICLFYWLVHKPLIGVDPIETLRMELNGRDAVRETRRCYVYSEEDQLVDWRDVEDHAREAEEKGFGVRREKVVGSGHCAHARGQGGKRYWEVVREAWEAGWG